MHKIDSKWILQLHAKCEVQKFLKTLEQLGLSKFGNMTSKST